MYNLLPENNLNGNFGSPSSEENQKERDELFVEDFESSDFACKHIIATLLEFIENKTYESRIKRSLNNYSSDKEEERYSKALKIGDYLE